VPRLGESVIEATVARWHKNVGDAVSIDDPLVELETDKVNVEVNAEVSGILSEIRASEGTNIAVGAVLGIISDAAARTMPAAPGSEKRRAPELTSVAAMPAKAVSGTRPSSVPASGDRQATVRGVAETFDVVVIGSGPGGYVAAIRAAQLGKKVACIEKRATLGGTCLNVGCIPSKTLLQSSERYVETKLPLAAHGIRIDSLAFDLKTMMVRKNKIVGDNTRGIEFLFDKNKVTHFRGTAQLAGSDTVQMTHDGGASETLKAKAIILATDSEPENVPGIDIDERRIVSSAGALSVSEVPERLIVIGAGYIGLEIGSVWNRLGSKVIVFEFLDRITPSMDGEVAKQLQRVLMKQGLVIRLGTRVTAAKIDNKGVILTLERVPTGTQESLSADAVLVAVGRRPHTAGLGLERVGVAFDERKRIKVDSQFRTNVPGIYAIGDVIAGPMLAHKAEDERIAVAEILAGQKPQINYDAIPAVSTLGLKSPPSARRRRSLRPRPYPTRWASSHSPRTAALVVMATPRGSSRSWPMPELVACSASTSWDRTREQ
jgi:dihydrolipoamide dehydrogenase